MRISIREGSEIEDDNGDDYVSGNEDEDEKENEDGNGNEKGNGKEVKRDKR